MNENNSTFNLGDSCLVKDEILNCHDYNSVLLSSIKNEIHPYQNNYDSNQSYNSEDIQVNNSNNITKDTLNASVKIIEEKDYEITSTENSISVIEDGYSIEDSFPSISSYLLSSINKENTTVQYNNDNNHYDKTNANSIKNIHGKLYDCNICRQSFTQKEDLKRHIVIHLGKSPHKCDTCQKSFTWKGVLKRHMLIHTGETPFKCSICQKLFKRKDNLKRHMLIHTDDKPYKCDICQKSYRNNKGLNRHMVIHTGESPHKCDICQKSFSLKGVLKRHMLIHTGEILYKCNICDKSYTRKGVLKRHMLIHTR